MPKFKSKLIKSDEILANGARVDGVVAWEPVNDAAKAHHIVDIAVSHGVYTPASPNEQAILKKKNKENMYRAMRKQGKITDEQLKAALASLK